MIKGDLVQRMEQLLADARAVRAPRRSCARRSRRACVPATPRSCSPTGRSTASSAACARRRPCACTPRGRWRPARPCCCGSSRARGEDDDVQDGVVVAHNPCLSGGSLEIFLDPHLAAPRVLIVGETPIARALEDGRARAAGYGVSRGGRDRSAAVRRGAGRRLARRRRGGARWRGRCRRASATSALVASPRRGAAVLRVARRRRRAALARPHARRAWTSARAHRPTSRSRSSPRWSPSARRTRRPRPPRRSRCDGGRPGLRHAGDGQRVHAAPRASAASDFYFCCEGCRSTYAARHSHAG